MGAGLPRHHWPPHKHLHPQIARCLHTRVVRWSRSYEHGSAGATAKTELFRFSWTLLFVEEPDRYFGNVCELDTIFNPHKAYYIEDELFTGYSRQELSKEAILRICARLSYVPPPLSTSQRMSKRDAEGGNKRQGGRQEHDRDSGVWQDSKNDRYNGGLKHGVFMVSWVVTEPTMPYIDSSKLVRYEHFILYWVLDLV
ncbi:hypothetical protein PHYSODRAFT_341628 [Phytophthora sojae]|uniref:AP complex mu/sigma subunit domain-containing protein n=1 Tax=Phytophthora sojae (strain P6497) TaxID=1094619 RepID=G5ADW6_PHYSP|nr:hypothetical protein PHYSODRAFT_341628 [Phytophthora sojae]EGZ06368.1 hypothetical protein PHYSODRAFT_341628 [Phytophthora sojae]|eukprot:XP_009538265.1 hypothetical protein PHYSODRAFT_341628 [Phytophthora sojae]